MELLREWKNSDIRKTFEQARKILRNHRVPGIVNLINEIPCGEVLVLILEFCSVKNDPRQEEERATYSTIE